MASQDHNIRACIEALSSVVTRLQAEATTLSAVWSQSRQPSLATAPAGPTSAGSTALPGMFVAGGGRVPHLGQAFVIGLGFAPIPYKTVVAIISGAYVEFGALLPKPSSSSVSAPTISIYGRVVLPLPKPPPQRLTDISRWSQAFSVYALVLCAYYPHRAPDLWRYFSSFFAHSNHFSIWPSSISTRPFGATRPPAAFRSVMNVELFNFHTSSPIVSSGSLVTSAESAGSSFSTLFGRSWNAGRCISSRMFCRYQY